MTDLSPAQKELLEVYKNSVIDLHSGFEAYIQAADARHQAFISCKQAGINPSDHRPFKPPVQRVQNIATHWTAREQGRDLNEGDLQKLRAISKKIAEACIEAQHGSPNTQYKTIAAAALREASDQMAECHYLPPNGNVLLIPVDCLLRIVSELEGNDD